MLESIKTGSLSIHDTSPNGDKCKAEEELNQTAPLSLSFLRSFQERPQWKGHLVTNPQKSLSSKELQRKRNKQNSLCISRCFAVIFQPFSNCFTTRGLSSDWKLVHFNAKFQKDLSQCLLHLCFLFSLWFGSTQTQKPKKSGWTDLLDFALNSFKRFPLIPTLLGGIHNIFATFFPQPCMYIHYTRFPLSDRVITSIKRVCSFTSSG